MKKKFALMSIIFLGIAAVCLCLRTKSLHNDCNPEIISHSDTISLYRNKSCTLEMPLPGLCAGQAIRVYLNVQSGQVELILLNSEGRRIKQGSSDKGNINLYCIEQDDDYRLLIDARDASFMFSVTIQNEPNI